MYIYIKNTSSSLPALCQENKMRGQDSITFGCVSAIFVFCVIMQQIEAQGDLSGQDMAEDESSQDMMEHDPNILNPINQEGYGRNIPTTVSDTSGKVYT